MRKRLILAALLVMIVAFSVPLVTPAGGAGVAAIMAQGKEKAKDKDLKKEKGKKGKDKKGKDKKGKDKKKEEEDSSTSSGIPGGNATLIALGVGGAVLVVGGLLVRRIFRRPAPLEEPPPGEDREERSSGNGDGG